MLEQIPWKSNKQNQSVTMILFTEQLQLQPRNSQQNHAQALLGSLQLMLREKLLKDKSALKCIEVVGFFKSTSRTSTENLSYYYYYYLENHKIFENKKCGSLVHFFPWWIFLPPWVSSSSHPSLFQNCHNFTWTGTAASRL